MSNQLYQAGADALIGGTVSWTSDAIKVVLVDTDDYTVNVDTDADLDDIPAGARVATSPELTSKTISSGQAKSTDTVTFSSVTGDQSEALVVYYDDEAATPTTILLAYIDDATGFPITPDGGDITLDWDNDIVFELAETQRNILVFADDAARDSSAPAGGTMGWVLDESYMYVYDSEAATPGWTSDVHAAQNQDYQLIEEVELSVDASEITFSSIPAYWRDLVLVGELRCTKAGDDEQVFLRCGNGTVDTGSNYRYVAHVLKASQTRTFDEGASGISIGRYAFPAATATTDDFGPVEVEIKKYLDTARWRTVQHRMGSVSANSGSLGSGVGAWENKADAIDIITVYPETLNFLAGSYLTLYGRGLASGPASISAAARTVVTPTQTTFKAADESVTSSTTLQDDDDLLATVEANTNYIFTLYLNLYAPAAADFKMGWTVPSGASLDWHKETVTISGTTGLYDSLTEGASEAIAGDASNDTFVVHGAIMTGGTAGTVNFQWAQNTSNGSATIVRQGSWLKVEETGVQG